MAVRKKGRKNIGGVGAAGGGVASGSDGDQFFTVLDLEPQSGNTSVWGPPKLSL